MANESKPSEEARWETFLERLRRVPDRLTALDAAGITRGALTERLESDEQFLERYRKAYEDGIDSMEDEAVRRAVVGVLEPVVSQGMIVTHKLRYSDSLMQFFLQAQRSKYRGTDDGEVLRPLSDEARARMSAIFSDAYADDPKLGKIAERAALDASSRRTAKPKKAETEKTNGKKAPPKKGRSKKDAPEPKKRRGPA